jgi:hypothetical protein
MRIDVMMPAPIRIYLHTWTCLDDKMMLMLLNIIYLADPVLMEGRQYLSLRRQLLGSRISMPISEGPHDGCSPARLLPPSS